MNFKKIIINVVIIFLLTFFIFSHLHQKKNINVILIVCDALRADHLSLYGYGRDTSKNIEQLGRNSFIFTGAFSQAPATRPAMFNILTSKYYTDYRFKDKPPDCLPLFFKSQGHQTAAITAQHLLAKKQTSFYQLFDFYDNQDQGEKLELSKRKAESVTSSAMEWIRKNKKKPYFLWLVYFDPHDPYDPPAAFKGYYTGSEKYSRDRRVQGIGKNLAGNPPLSSEHKQFLIDAYDEEIRYFDYELGRFLQFLKKSGQYQNSIIILTADHGEELGDNGNLWDHCQLLSKEETHVPLIIKMPRQNKKKNIKEVVQTIDIFPTLVEFFEKKHWPSFYYALEGNSLFPLLNGQRLPFEPYAASFWFEQKSLILGSYKLWLVKGREYLIDLQTRQVVNNPARLAQMKDFLEEVIKKEKLKLNTYKFPLQSLRSLGYLQ